MTNRERFIKTLKCEPIGGQVPTFELVFFLNMEAFGKVHPAQRRYDQWNQMSQRERTLHMNEMAQLYIDTAKRYGHSAIMIHPVLGDLENTQWLIETIREKSGDEYFLLAHGDPTWAIPDGNSMMDFAVKMYEDPDALNDESAKRMEEALEFAAGSGCDALAVAIGTAHGVYKEKPKLNLQCLHAIAGACEIPLVLHGGSGLSDDDFRACVAGGISKINIFTHNNLTAARAAQAAFSEKTGAFELMPIVAEAVKRETMHHIKVFGSDGKA